MPRFIFRLFIDIYFELITLKWDICNENQKTDLHSCSFVSSKSIGGYDLIMITVFVFLYFFVSIQVSNTVISWEDSRQRSPAGAL